MVRDMLFALPVCNIKIKASLGGSHIGHQSTHSGLLGDGKAILAVVLKRAALTNNSEFGYPTFFPAPTPGPSIPNEGGTIAR